VRRDGHEARWSANYFEVFEAAAGVDFLLLLCFFVVFCVGAFGAGVVADCAKTAAAVNNEAKIRRLISLSFLNGVLSFHPRFHVAPSVPLARSPAQAMPSGHV
jgi:hypothetical protein